LQTTWLSMKRGLLDLGKGACFFCFLSKLGNGACFFCFCEFVFHVSFPCMLDIEGSDAKLSICSFVGICSASTSLCCSL